MVTANGNKDGKIISPYGGELVNLVAPKEEQPDLVMRAKVLPSMQISFRSMCDLELLATGAFSPLDRFMGEKQYLSVLHEMRLTDGALFPVPVTLPADRVAGLKIGGELVLRSPTNEMLALMQVEEIYTWNRKAECMLALGTTDSRHPLVSEMHQWGRYCLSGPLTVFTMPRHNSFPELRRTPAQVRSALEDMGRKNVIAYQPRHAMHRPHEALTKSAVEEANASLLIQPVVGMANYNDIEHFTRIRCYQALVANHYDPSRTLLNLLPLAVRAAGPRAGLWHGIINRNYGSNYYIMGRDPHGPGRESDADVFYDSRAVQELFLAHENEVGVRMIPQKEMVYVPGKNRYEESDRIADGPEKFIRVSSETVLKEAMYRGKPLPEWFTHREVGRILLQANPPRTRQGFCVWLTGLPSSGKSTIAEALASLLLAEGRKVTLLDGDVVRTHLTKGLGFSREDRTTNILRVGFVAAEVVRHGGAVITALISPYASARDQVRAMVGSERFIEVFVDTPFEVCRERDVKGMYTMAKDGRIKGFTGVDDGYEPPRFPELSVDTVSKTPEQTALQIRQILVSKRFVNSGKNRRAEQGGEENAPEYIM